MAYRNKGEWWGRPVPGGKRVRLKAIPADAPKSDADAEEGRLRDEAKSKGLIASASPVSRKGQVSDARFSIADAAELYRPVLVRRISRGKRADTATTTLDDALKSFAHPLSPIQVDTPIVEIDDTLADRWMGWRTAGGVKLDREIHGKRQIMRAITHGTAMKHLRPISAALKECARVNACSRGVYSHFRGLITGLTDEHPVDAARPCDLALTRAQASGLLAELRKQRNPQWAEVFPVLWGTAIDLSELLGIEGRDVQQRPAGLVLIIRASVASRKRGKFGPREIPVLFDDTEAALKAALLRSDGGRLFAHFTAHDIAKAGRRAALKAGDDALAMLRPKDLRHTAITWWLNMGDRGQREHSVKQWAGHSPRSDLTGYVYSNANSETLEDAFARKPVTRPVTRRRKA